MGVGSEGVAEFLDAAAVIDDDTRPRPSPSARRGDCGKREITGRQRPESRSGGGLLNRGAQGGQPGLVRGSHSKLSVSVTLLARGRANEYTSRAGR
jgi:hypothetical protein